MVTCPLTVPGNSPSEGPSLCVHLKVPRVVSFEPVYHVPSLVTVTAILKELHKSKKAKSLVLLVVCFSFLHHVLVLIRCFTLDFNGTYIRVL